MTNVVIALVVLLYFIVCNPEAEETCIGLCWEQGWRSAKLSRILRCTLDGRLGLQGSETNKWLGLVHELAQNKSSNETL